MTRRFFLFLACTFMTLGAVGCGQSGSSGGGEAGTAATGGAASTPAPATSGKLRIGVSTPAATHGWPAGVIWWANETMKQYPDVEWTFQQASKASDQASQIDTMLQKGIDALVVLPFDSDTPLPAVMDAKSRGVFVVSVDRGLRQPVADLYIAGDNRAFGRKSAEYMAQKLGGKGNIVILRGMPVEIDTERYEGAMEVFNQHPEIKVLGAQPGNWNRQDAYRVMQGFLTQHPKIDAVWASDDDMALGVEDAIKDAGRTGEMWILGGAGMKDIIKRVQERDPLFPADITYPPGMIAAGIHAAVAAKRPEQAGEIVKNIPDHLGVDEADLTAKVAAAVAGDEQQSSVLEVQLVTPENAGEHYFAESVY